MVRAVDRYSCPILSDNQSLALVVVPQGGGSGNNAGKLIGRIIGTLAIVIAAAYGQEYVWGGLGPLWGGTYVGSALISAGVVIAGGIVFKRSSAHDSRIADQQSILCDLFVERGRKCCS